MRSLSWTLSAMLFIGFTIASVRGDDRDSNYQYLDNGVVCIGVDESRGACIAYFAESGGKQNVLNHFDHGRFIQQSYYGDVDGSDWNGKPWQYNPVQGGSWDGVSSRLLEFRKNDTGSRLSTKVEPRHWARGNACPEAIMEQWISLRGPVAQVRCKLTYTGHDHKSAKHQEMPAVFVDAALQHLVYVEDGEIKRRIPGWPNESGKTSADWVAYLDNEDRGIGILTPGTSDFTCYRYEGDGTMGPRGSACSYVAPLRTIQLKMDLTIEYDFYLTLGTLNEIEHRFSPKQIALISGHSEQ